MGVGLAVEDCCGDVHVAGEFEEFDAAGCCVVLFALVERFFRVLAIRCHAIRGIDPHGNAEFEIEDEAAIAEKEVGEDGDFLEVEVDAFMGAVLGLDVAEEDRDAGGVEADGEVFGHGSRDGAVVDCEVEGGDVAG